MYKQRLYKYMSLISYPYSNSSAPPYLGTAILTILCFLETEEQEAKRLILQLQYPLGNTDNNKPRRFKKKKCYKKKKKITDYYPSKKLF